MKKITPKHDLSWWIKWISSFAIIVAVGVRSADPEGVYKLYDFAFGGIGTLGWLAVGILWHDRALIILNTVMMVMLSIGVINLLTIGA